MRGIAIAIVLALALLATGCTTSDLDDEPSTARRFVDNNVAFHAPVERGSAGFTPKPPVADTHPPSWLPVTSSPQAQVLVPVTTESQASEDATA